MFWTAITRFAEDVFVPSVDVTVILYSLSPLASAGASKSGVVAKARAPDELSVKSAASAPVIVVLKVGVVPSASVAVNVPTAEVPSATLNDEAEVKTGELSLTAVTLTTIASVSVLLPSLATTFSE